MYRPKDWDARKMMEAYGQSCPNEEMIGDFEAGADAMYQPAFDKGKAEGKKELLEALKKQGMPVATVEAWDDILSKHKMIKISYVNILRKQVGWLVFIPDDYKFGEPTYE